MSDLSLPDLPYPIVLCVRIQESGRSGKEAVTLVRSASIQVLYPALHLCIGGAGMVSSALVYKTRQSVSTKAK